LLKDAPEEHGQGLRVFEVDHLRRRVEVTNGQGQGQGIDTFLERG
jgi:hypothetical protein